MDTVGYVGGSILGFQLLPQIYKTYQLRSATQLSYVFILLNLIGLTCMTIYGISLSEKPLYIPTTISLVMTSVLLFEKIYFDVMYTLPVEII